MNMINGFYLVEIELQVFVGIVDAKLFEVVLIAEVFEPEDVQNADVIAFKLKVNCWN